METHDQISDEPEWDPVFLHSRREAIVIVATWFVALIWTVPFCYLNGFQPESGAREVTFILGMPSWVFYGIACPWMAANLVTVWFCFGYFQVDELGEEGESPEELPRDERTAT